MYGKRRTAEKSAAADLYEKNAADGFADVSAAAAEYDEAENTAGEPAVNTDTETDAGTGMAVAEIEEIPDWESFVRKAYELLAETVEGIEQGE